MSTGRGRRLQSAAACAALVAYAGLSHYCNSTGQHVLGALLALMPLSLLGLILAWRWTPPALAVLLTAGLAGLIYTLWPLMERNFSLFYLVQESSIYCLLGLTFGRSLLPGQVALCTQFADKIHGPLGPREVRYTRRVTLAWALFFFSVATVSVALYVLAPLRVWSIYINFCVLPLVAAMFVTEYLIRRRVVPQGTRAGLLTSVRVYFANPQ